MHALCSEIYMKPPMCELASAYVNISFYKQLFQNHPATVHMILQWYIVDTILLKDVVTVVCPPWLLASTLIA